MQLAAPAPLADHPLADPRPIWAAGVAGGTVKSIALDLIWPPEFGGRRQLGGG